MTRSAAVTAAAEAAASAAPPLTQAQLDRLAELLGVPESARRAS